MKKLLLSVAALMAFTAVSAQETTTGSGFSDGDTFLTGSLGYSSTKTGDAKVNEFTVSARLGFFVTSNIAIGPQLTYLSGTSTEINPITGDDMDVDTSAFEAGAFGRYYFTPARNFSFFGQLQLAYVTAKTESDFGDIKADGFGFELAPGVSYFVSDHIAFEATFGVLGYNTVKPDVDGAESTDTFEIGADFTQINFGMVYKF